MQDGKRKLALSLYRSIFIACKEYVALGRKNQVGLHPECTLFHKRLSHPANRVSIHPLVDTEAEICGDLVYDAVRKGFQRNKNLHYAHSSVVDQNIDDGFIALRFILRRSEIFRTRANKLTRDNKLPLALVSSDVPTQTNRTLPAMSSSSSSNCNHNGSNIP